MSYGTTQRYRIENLLCLTCAKPLPSATKILFCSECANTRKKQQLTLVAARKELGLCTVCGKAKPYIGAKCETCVTRNAVYQKRARDRREDRGVCLDCGKNSPLEIPLKEVHYPLCEECYFKKLSRWHFGTRKHWQFLKQKLVEQDYRCPYTGELIVLGMNDSLDHIYPSARYPERAKDLSNVEWVTREINAMKLDRTPDEFMALMHRIIEYREGDKYSLQGNLLNG